MLPEIFFLLQIFFVFFHTFRTLILNLTGFVEDLLLIMMSSFLAVARARSWAVQPLLRLV